MVMIVWSASSYQKCDIWETLSINCDCVWAPSIDVINTKSTSPHPAVVLRSGSSWHVSTVDLRCCRDRSLWTQKSLISPCLTSLSHILSISFSYDQTLARSSLYPRWISMAHIQTLFLPGAVQTVKWNDCQTPWAVVDSKSAGLYPKHTLSSPTIMTLFWLISLISHLII